MTLDNWRPAGRHTVVRSDARVLFRWRVTRSAPPLSPGYGLHYVTVSRHMTRRGAERVRRRLNLEIGVIR